MKATNTTAFINNLNAGVFTEQVGRALSDVAAGVIDHGKKGTVSVTFDFTQIGETNQVKVTHKLKYTQPTKRGSKSEDTALDTPMYVSEQGVTIENPAPNGNLFSVVDAPIVAREA
ncbi:hypothetical protein VQ643_09625 [Pseudomonas sp. F1_0610]|uniref:hypothetical protein n=1 Tax=Pseudomonas sp. F1_0610 TaxID=3114284 RepID=UPI0039C29E48